MSDHMWHLEHADGREWTRNELERIIYDHRRHDHLWPWDATLFTVTIERDSTVYLLDSCMTWHMPAIQANDLVVVWDE